MKNRIISMLSTARQVELARRELLASFSNPGKIPVKVAVYTAAVKRHRELIFADVLREVRPSGIR